MKICMFTNTYLPHVGGVARSVSTFAVDLRLKGHEVLIIAPTFPSVRPGTDEEAGVFRVPALQNFNGSDFSVRLPIPYYAHERIEAFAPDIVHSHHPFLLGDTALRTSRARGLPLLFTHHTLYENYTHYVPFDAEIVKSFVIRLSTEYANLCCGVIAPSGSVARLLRSRGVERQIAEIPTGVDIDFLGSGQGERFRRQHHLAGSTALIGHVGRLAAEKNLLFLARAVAIYLRQNRSSRFVAVGRGDAEKEMGQIFARAGVHDQVLMTGPLVHGELADAYQAMDLFVFTSQSETQGLVLAEAMAAGTPVLALDASGAREVVEDRRNGRLLTAQASEEEFARAIEEFFHDPVAAQAWRHQARHTARQFSRTACADRLIGFYEQILHRHSTARETPKVDLGEWLSVMEMLKAEWQLLSEKMAAAVQAVKAGERES